MRRLSFRGAAALLTLLLMAAAPGCRRRTTTVETVEEDNAQLASVVQTNDAKASMQLLKGFYDIENGAWRWTKSEFSVTLKAPPEARTKGAVLKLSFSVTEPLLQHTRTTTLSAVANGSVLEPETYTKAGQYTYERKIPAADVQGEAVTIDFRLDKFLTAGQVEERELGLVVASAGLYPQ